MFEQLSDHIAAKIGMDPMKVRGFLWRSAKEWQLQEHRSIAELAHLEPAERIRDARDITAIFEQKMLAVLPRQMHERFREALNDTWQEYRKNYSMRRPGTRPDV